MVHLRPLERKDIERIWSIDRSETQHHLYRVEGANLVRIPAPLDMRAWPPEQVARDTPILHACFDRGGLFMGMFDDAQLVGVAVLDIIPIGNAPDQLQLKYLYVSRSHRRKGVGQTLFREAQSKARARGAKAIYISATPTENTVNFYLRCGAVVAPTPDPELYALEPDDIHMICPA